MLRALPALIGLVLAIYCLVEVIQCRRDEARLLPRFAWAIIIIVIPFVGPIGWLFLGRPQRDNPAAPVPPSSTPRRPVAPDDDPEFLERLSRQRQREREEKLSQWEDELSRRERELGDKDEPDESTEAGNDEQDSSGQEQSSRSADEDPGTGGSTPR